MTLVFFFKIKYNFKVVKKYMYPFTTSVKKNKKIKKKS